MQRFLELIVLLRQNKMPQFSWQEIKIVLRMFLQYFVVGKKWLECN